MKSTEIKHNVQNLIDNFSKEEFVFDLLVAYGISKTSVTRLKKGDYNLSKVDGELLYKKKIFFKVEVSDKLLSSIEDISKEERILKQQPRFAILTDYRQLVAKDLKLGKNLDIQLKELPNYFDFFLPLAGSEVYNATNNNEADRNASYKMASLYDLLIEQNPKIYNSKESIHNLNIFLSRLLFCLFAEDTEIFEQESIFTNTLAQHTAENGKDTHTFLDSLFNRLDTESGKEYPNFLAKFPYVNGGLFNQKINSPLFTAKARKTLIELGGLQWAAINPDIFGSMIQAVVIPEYRSDLGMHYTSVENIKKLIKPLFLDELYEEYENATTVTHLKTLVHRISKIKFFDPACGSGNFLIITYKEIRLLEILILEKITDLQGNAPTIKWTAIQLFQFYGIEIDDFAHEMAILSLWLAEHQMNQEFFKAFGRTKPALPLQQTGSIVHGNATRIDWEVVCPKNETDEIYILGNPPYLGARLQSDEQKSDMEFVFNKIKGFNNLDYISCWFLKGSNYIDGSNAQYSFVTTNSICQGEQVALLWPFLLKDNLEIGFAHTSFKWENNAKANAGVTVSIICLRNQSSKPKFIYKNDLKLISENINSYLVDAKNTFVEKRTKPISKLPEMCFGSMANDGGNLFLNEQEKENLISKYPEASKLIKKLVGALEFIRGENKYCLWINDEDLELANQIPEIANRIEKCKQVRLSSKRGNTNDLASVAYKFGEIRFKETDSIIIPRHSSENREYIPIGFLNNDTVIADSALSIYNAEASLLSILTSKIHMYWIKSVGGKLETRIRYSTSLCYNTFPFPPISQSQKQELEQCVFRILEERENHSEKTLAQLYDPNKMPIGLREAHSLNDLAVERCYRSKPFESDEERLEYLFKLYEKMIAEEKENGTLFNEKKKAKKQK